MTITISPSAQSQQLSVDYSIDIPSGTQWVGEINAFSIPTDNDMGGRQPISGTGSSSGSVTLEFPNLEERIPFLVTGLIIEPISERNQDQREITVPPGENGLLGPIRNLSDEELVLLSASLLAGGIAVGSQIN